MMERKNQFFYDKYVNFLITKTEVYFSIFCSFPAQKLTALHTDDVGKVTDAKLISTVNYLTTFTCSLFFIWTFAENILWSHAAVNNISPRARALNLFIVLMRGSVDVRQ
jgi:hypothetical protein